MSKLLDFRFLRPVLVLLAIVLVMATAALLTPQLVRADPPVVAASTGGAITLVANVAQAIPTSSLSGRTVIAVYNLHATVATFCLFDSAVTTLTGWPVPANGSASFAMPSAPTSNGTLYCVTSGTMTSTTNLRYLEIR